jgi:hypothetical protein
MADETDNARKAISKAEPRFSLRFFAVLELGEQLIADNTVSVAVLNI